MPNSAGGNNRKANRYRRLGVGSTGPVDPPDPPPVGAPNPPSPVTAATPATLVMGWGGGGSYATQSMANFQTIVSWGPRGTGGRMGNNFLYGSTSFGNLGGGNDSKGSSAAGDSGSQWNYQKAFQGLGVAAINGGATGLGQFKAKEAGIIDYCSMNVKLVQSGYTTSWAGPSTTPAPAGYTVKSPSTVGPPFCAWTDDENWALVCAAAGRRAAMMNYLGGDALHFDPEDQGKSAWRAGTGWHRDGGPSNKTTRDYGKPAGGLTLAAQNAFTEQRGYEFFSAIYDEFQHIDIVIYQWEHIDNGWPAKQGVDRLGRLVYLDPYGQGGSHTWFFLGGMRAHADANSHGRFVNANAWWYRGNTQYGGPSYIDGSTLPSASLDVALKWDSQGPLASWSRVLSATVRNQVFPYIACSPMSWAGTDFMSDAQWVAAGSDPNTSHGGYGNNQEGQPTWTNNQEKYRRCGMLGFRVEYNYDGTFLHNAGQGLYQGQNNYSYPAGRLAAWTPTMTNTTDNYSNVAPTISSPTVSGSGSTRTLTGTASHPLGIHYVKAYVYPNGAQCIGSMVWNLGGGDVTNISNSYMEYTIPLTGVSAGTYAIVTAYSIQNQQKSVVVAL